MSVPKHFFYHDNILPDVIETELSTRIQHFEQALASSDTAVCPDYPEFRKELECALVSSGFIARTITKNPAIISDLAESGDLLKSCMSDSIRKRVNSVRQSSGSIEELASGLRKVRAREYVRIAWRDINGISDLDETMKDLSILAEACVDETSEFIYEELAGKYGYPEKADGGRQKLVILGMGKLGARELNFSSDIDLIFAYPENRWISNEITSDEFFTRLARMFLKVFSESSPDGLLFRVDMRLRPYGDSGPLVMNFSAMEDYYQSQGREWERYALIKARAVSGMKEDAASLARLLQPFVYRRYLDYSTFEAIRDLKKSIAAEVRRKQLDRNIKLGAGGIREIEFFGQVFQLLRGGVEADLRKRSILKILGILCSRNYIPCSTRQELESAYYFFRNLEHRIQEVEDLQTHDLPESPTERLRISLGMGFPDVAGFERTLAEHQKKVHGHFKSLLGDDEEEHREHDDLTLVFEKIWENPEKDSVPLEIFYERGFRNPENALSSINYIKELSLKQAGTNGKLKLDRLMPVLLSKISESGFPDTALSRITDLLKAIMQRTCYIALLQENAASVDNLVKLASSSPWIINFLSRHPVLLDELLDRRTLYSPPSKAELKEDLEYRLSQIEDENIETQMDILCVFKQSRLLRVAAADITSSYPLMRVSDHLTEIAETILEKVLKLSFIQLFRRYAGNGPSPENSSAVNSFAIIGYGKLGGIELGYGSDLDLVFLYNNDDGYPSELCEVESSYFFTRLAQRIIHFLTTHSSAGTLYETDTRLRPSGNSGMLVTSMKGFDDYLLNEAWTWEHQAIVRARVIAGGVGISERFRETRKKILCMKRDIPRLQKEIAEMSVKIRTSKRKNPVSGFHLKYDRGGITDLEFFVQFLVLAYSSDYPEMSVWTDNVRILETAAGTGIITEDAALEMKRIYLAYRTEVHKRDLLGLDHETGESVYSGMRAFVVKMWEKYIG